VVFVEKEVSESVETEGRVMFVSDESGEFLDVGDETFCYRIPFLKVVKFVDEVRVVLGC
jgi:hypothetical protein